MRLLRVGRTSSKPPALSNPDNSHVQITKPGRLKRPGFTGFLCIWNYSHISVYKLCHTVDTYQKSGLIKSLYGNILKLNFIKVYTLPFPYCHITGLFTIYFLNDCLHFIVAVLSLTVRS